MDDAPARATQQRLYREQPQPDHEEPRRQRMAELVVEHARLGSLDPVDLPVDRVERLGAGRAEVLAAGDQRDLLEHGLALVAESLAQDSRGRSGGLFG